VNTDNSSFDSRARQRHTMWATKCLVGTLLVFVGGTTSAQKSLSDGIKDLGSQIATSATKAQKQKIATLPFRDLDGSPTVLGTYLAESLSTQLVNSGLEVVERNLLDKVLSELKLQQTGAIDSASAKEVGHIAGVDAIITGSIANLNAVLAINCRLIDTQTGRVFAAAETMITRDAMVESIIGQTAPSSAAPTPAQGHATSKSSSGKPSWTRGGIRVVVDSASKKDGWLTMLLAFENDTDADRKVTVGKYHLIDENGDRWDYWDDSQNFVYAVTVSPRTRARSSFRFHCTGGECTGGRFTIVHEDGTIVLRDLRID
jgi:curli biogenesis system outer membrane secretion channel CsgG